MFTTYTINQIDTLHGQTNVCILSDCFKKIQDLKDHVRITFSHSRGKLAWKVSRYISLKRASNISNLSVTEISVRPVTETCR